jgi:hypothetical protein
LQVLCRNNSPREPTNEQRTSNEQATNKQQTSNEQATNNQQTRNKQITENEMQVFLETMLHSTLSFCINLQHTCQACGNFCISKSHL